MRLRSGLARTVGGGVASRPDRARDMDLISEHLAACLLNAPASGAPLAHCSSTLSEATGAMEEVGSLYGLYLRGAL